ncbi:MAG: hypothetical protein Q3983_05715 [Capnocytophaga sp.]|nr:hypothetical protein [Capnocytophaga sp.]
MVEKYNSKKIEYSGDELVICIGENYSQLPIFGCTIVDWDKNGREISRWCISFGENKEETEEKYITIRELITKNPKIEPFLHLEPRFSFILDEEGEDVWEEEV